MGCDRAVQVVDPEGRASSPHAAARVLAEVLRQEPFDLILAGTQSDDLSYAQTGVILAELLGLPHATIVMDVQAQPDKGSIKALREMESGSFQWVELPLPAPARDSGRKFPDSVSLPEGNHAGQEKGDSDGSTSTSWTSPGPRSPESTSHDCMCPRPPAMPRSWKETRPQSQRFLFRSSEKKQR